MWKIRGLGQVKILKDKKSGSCRVLMRQEKTLKPVANFTIYEGMPIVYQTGSTNFLCVTATDFSDEKPEQRSMLFKFKTDDLAAAFKKAFEAAASSNQTSNETFKVDDSTYDVNDKETWFDLHKILTRPTKWDNASGHCRNPITVKRTELRYDESDGCAYPKESFLEVYVINSLDLTRIARRKNTTRITGTEERTSGKKQNQHHIPKIHSHTIRKS